MESRFGGTLPPAKERALKSAERYIALTRFSLQATADRHRLGKVSAVMLPPPLPEGPGAVPDPASPASFRTTRRAYRRAAGGV